jgi:predicted transcriptional regulator
MADPSPTALTVEIVAAYLANNTVAVADIPDLIRTTYMALAGTASPVTEQPADRLVPAVPVRKSVTPGAIICMDCGKSFKMLRRHLETSHALGVDDYRTKWGLPANYPVVAPDYAARRSELAVTIGLGHNRKGRKVTKTA